MQALPRAFVLFAWFTSSLAMAVSPMEVMTFNIRFGGETGQPTEHANAWLATSGQHRRDLVTRLVANSDPDLLCLQEALINQVADLQGALPGHAFFGVGRDDGVEKGETCGIFYRRDRFTKTDGGNFWLNETPDQAGTFFPKTCCARLATWMVLRDSQADDREFLLLNTHWDHQVQPARLFSAELIRKRLETLANDRPILFTGDLNVKTKNRAFQLLVTGTPENRLELLGSYRETHPQAEKDEGTFHAFRGNTDGPRIDYVLHSDDFLAQKAEILRTHEQRRYPSDHFPVTATLILAK